MIARVARIIMGVLVASAAVPAAGEQPGDAKVRVKLVSSSERASGGERLLGVRFEIEPGWHIYWKNPGGAGMSTEVRWRLPRGVEAGELQWPLPVFFFQSGQIPGYGYEGSVVLASEIRSASPPGAATRVGAEVSWLACKDVCVLGSAEIEARWSEVPEDPDFRNWDSAVPSPWRDDEVPFSVTTTGGLDDGKLTLWLEWQGPARPFEWFPDPPEGLVVENTTSRTRGGLSRIDVSLRQMAGASGPFEVLPSVVTVSDDNQKRRGWQLAVDLNDDNP